MLHVFSVTGLVPGDPGWWLWALLYPLGYFIATTETELGN